MNRNTELHMGSIPRIYAKRSKIDRSNSIKTTWLNGKCIPFWWDEVYPADTVQIDMGGIIRMATPITPVMDDIYMDVYFFFVPARLTWRGWKRLWGENNDPWAVQLEGEVPQLNAPEGGWTRHTIADYMGIPTYTDGFKVNALPFRAYSKIMSDWFRSENIEYVCHMYDDETTRTGTNGNDYVTDTELGGEVYTANKLADYYTRALPAPQKGPDVAIPIGTSAPIVRTSTGTAGTVPVNIINEPTDLNVYAGATARTLEAIETNPIQFNTTAPNGNYSTFISVGDNKGNIAGGNSETPQNYYSMYPNNLYARIPEAQASSDIFSGEWSTYTVKADLEDATGATINELRTAFAIQKFYEAQSRGGSRYIEFCLNIFGVSSSDARLQRSEYIGGTRVKLNMETVLQTSSTDATTPQGNPAGYSCTLMRKSLFTKSFEEHGFLIGILVTRTEHSYQQGLEKKWTRKKWTDYYNPFFANLGEQPILNKNIYLQSDTEVDEQGRVINDQVFGYQEAWAELRYSPNIVTGDFRSNSPVGSIDKWTYVDDYDELPKLSEEWLREGTANVDRTLAMQSSITHQMWGDLYLNQKWTRNIPVYSMPGLIDHV